MGFSLSSYEDNWLWDEIHPENYMLTDPKQIDLYAFLVMRARLKIELALGKQASGSHAAKTTMMACRHHGFKGRTRQNALEWVNFEITKRKNELAEV